MSAFHVAIHPVISRRSCNGVDAPGTLTLTARFPSSRTRTWELRKKSQTRSRSFGSATRRRYTRRSSRIAGTAPDPSRWVDGLASPPVLHRSVFTKAETEGTADQSAASRSAAPLGKAVSGRGDETTAPSYTGRRAWAMSNFDHGFTEKPFPILPACALWDSIWAATTAL